RLADSERDGQTSRGWNDDRKLRDHGANFRVGAQEAAQAHGKQPLVLVVSQGNRNLQILVRVSAVGIFVVAITEGAGFPQQGDNLILGWYQMHRLEFLNSRPGR